MNSNAHIAKYYDSNTSVVASVLLYCDVMQWLREVGKELDFVNEGQNIVKIHTAMKESGEHHVYVHTCTIH
jgi:hypothetical protein